MFVVYFVIVPFIRFPLQFVFTVGVHGPAIEKVTRSIDALNTKCRILAVERSDVPFHIQNSDESTDWHRLIELLTQSQIR